MDLEYRLDDPVTVEEVIDLYRDSRLGQRRPIHDPAVMGDMIRHANLVATCREDGLLLGLARTFTDFSYMGYVSDLAVRARHQRQGIGVELLRRTRLALGPQAYLVLLAAPEAEEYYPRIGFESVASAWILKAGQPLAGDTSSSPGPEPADSISPIIKRQINDRSS